MNGIYNPIVFYPTAILIILFAFLALKFRNIFYSLLSAILVFFLAGLIFYVLGSEYNAIIQIAIYGVAVPIILGLSVMFTNFNNTKPENENIIFKYTMFLFCGLFIITLFKALPILNPLGFDLAENIIKNPTQVITAFSKGIFVNYVWAFEVLSIILTIIVVGLTLFIKKKGDK